LTPEQLTELFTIHDAIRVVNNATVTNIAGLVPAGKLLEISGAVQVIDGGSLTINGTVHILNNGWLAAVANPGTSGMIDRGSTGLLLVDGTLEPDPYFFDNGIPSYVRIDPASTTAVVRLNHLIVPTTPAEINYLFEMGIPTIDTDYDELLGGISLAALPAWTGTKKLISREDQTFPTDTVDVSDKGPLVISGTVTLGDSVGTTGATLKASDDGNVTVSPEGGIVLDYGLSSLAGGITINGTLGVSIDMVAVAPASGGPDRIPASVNLANATITNAGASKIVLPATARSIGGIVLGADVEIIGATGLSVNRISSGGAFTLTLPAIPVSVEILEAATGNFTITGQAASAILSPARVITTAVNLAMGANTVLSGPIELFGTISLTDLTNLGSAAEGQFAQLARISGGEVTTTVALPFVSGVYNTHITTADAASFTGNITFNDGLAITGAVTTDAGAVTITLNDVVTINGGLTSTASLLTLNGTGSLALTGAGTLTTGALTVNNGGGLQLNGSTTTVNGILTVGPGALIATHTGGPRFDFGPGTYTPSTGFTVTTNGTILALPGTVDASLILGDQAAGSLTLVSTAASAATTFTLANGTGVTLSGAGSGAVIVGTGTTLTPGADTRIVLGNGAVALSGGTLDPAEIRGFTYHKGPSDVYALQTTDYDTNTYRGTLLGTPYSGGGLTINDGGSAAYAVNYDGTSGVFNYGTLTDTEFVDAGVGALITKISDIAH
jgi:hypothetical protein